MSTTQDDVKNPHISEKSVADSGFADDDIILSPEDERRLKRKIDWRIVPYLSLLYLLSFLDRVNIGQARTANLEKDLHLVGNQYQVCRTSETSFTSLRLTVLFRLP